MTEYRTISRQTADAVWSSICRRLNEDVTKINSELKRNHLHLDMGNIIGLVKVWEYDSERKESNTLGFELMMNTGGLEVWYQEGMIRSRQPVDSVIDRDSDTLLVRYQGEPMAIEEMVDRVLKRWLEKKWKMVVFETK